MDEVSQPQPQPQPQPLRLQFTGTGSEYFRIWIVNLLLLIVTVGLYHPWAKVRRQQYFYRNTQFAGSGFEFHGQPMAIFKGMVIAGVAVLAFYSFDFVPWWLAVVFAVILIALVPWLIRSALRFRRYNSSYRGLRFGFSGSTKAAYWAYAPVVLALVLPSLAGAVMGKVVNLESNLLFGALASAAGLLTFAVFAMWPFFQALQKRYAINHSAIGQAPFSFTAEGSQFYAVHLKTSLWFFLSIVVLMIGFGVSAGFGVFLDSSKASAAGGMLVVWIVLFYLSFFALFAYYTARMMRLIWSHTALAAQKFQTDIAAIPLIKITLVNWLLTLLTLGLYRPFAVMRTLKYKTEDQLERYARHARGHTASHTEQRSGR